MQQFLKKNMRLILIVFIITLLIAGFLDIKYEGLFFHLLPDRVQQYLV